MQGQFDQWYSTLHARGGMVGQFTANNNNNPHESAYAPSMEAMRGRYDPPDAPSSSSSSYSLSVDVSSSGPKRVGATAGAGYNYRADVSDDGSSSDAYHNGSHNNNQSFRATSQLESKQAAVAVAAAAQRQGGGGVNSSSMSTTSSFAPAKVTDDPEVNEDIMAFYQAREDLLKRRGAK